jgi:TPR repeat protein
MTADSDELRDGKPRRLGMVRFVGALGFFMLTMKDADAPDSEVLKQYQLTAQQGDSAAMTKVGRMLQKGWGGTEFRRGLSALPHSGQPRLRPRDDQHRRDV